MYGDTYRCFVDFYGSSTSESIFGSSTNSTMTGIESSENHLVKLEKVQKNEAETMPTFIETNAPYSGVGFSIWPNAEKQPKIPILTQGTITVFFKEGIQLPKVNTVYEITLKKGCMH